MKKLPLKNPVKNAFNGLYVAFIAFFAFVLISGAVKGARRHQGVRPDAAPVSSVDAAAVASCLSDMERLDAELRERMNAVFSATPARHSSETEWETWSPQWRTRLMEVSARCRLDENDVPAAAPLHGAYEGLVRAHRLYTTLSVQFAQGIGPTADQLEAAMKAARQAVSPTPDSVPAQAD